MEEDFEVRSIFVDGYLGEIESSSGNVYLTSLRNCSCPDFVQRQKPCKHMYFLAGQAFERGLPQPIIPTNTNYTSYEPPERFEDRYSYSADSLMGKYEYACREVKSIFYSDFNLKHRIKALEKTLKKYEAWKDFCYDKGDDEIAYFNESYAPYDRPYVPGARDMNGSYEAEYANAEFCNVDFLKSVLNEYLTNPDESAAHLLEEQIYYCGGSEEYEFMLKLESLPRDLLKVIRKNDGVLQKDLYGLFDERLKNHIPKAVKNLTANGKIISMKSGSSCMLRIRK